MSHTSEVNNQTGPQKCLWLHQLHHYQTTIPKLSLWSPTALSASFITQKRKMPSRSSSIRPLVPHQSDHNPAFSKPENYPSMLHGHFDMKKKTFLSKSMISTGLPEPESSGVIFSCNVLKLDWVVKAWEELAGMYTAAPHPNLLCYKHKKVCKL